MNPAAIQSIEKPGRRQSLSDAVSNLRDEFSRMEDELRSTRQENCRLRVELARARTQLSSARQTARNRPRQEMDLPRLRRQVAYYCHPDRGGDADLMCRLNNLFDFLTSMWRQPQVCLQAARKG